MYEDKYVRRGEIYQVKSGETNDVDGGMTRPGLIVSSNIMNSQANAVIVVFLTTTDNNIGIHYGPIMNTGRKSYICCERIMQVSKTRLGKLMGSLSENQMREVESRLDDVLDLGYVDDTPVKEKEQEINALKLQMEELRSEVLRLRTSLDAKDDAILTRDVEIAVHKRMYEKAVGIIAAMRAEPDLPKPLQYVREIEQTKISKPVEEPKKPEPPKPKEPKLVDINSATFSQLRGIGLSNNSVLTIINKRPFEKVEDLKNVPGIKAGTFRIIEKKICCVPVKTEEPPKIEEPKPTLDDGAELEAAVAVAKVDEEPAVVKVNVNTASAVEIHDATGLSMTACYAITGKRNRDGLYKSLDELVIPGRLSEATLAKYRDKMEV